MRFFRLTFFAVGMPAALVTIPTFAAGNGQVSISRDEMVDHLCRKMTLSAGKIPGVDQDQRPVFLERVRGEMRGIGGGLFPETLTATSAHALNRILATNMIIDEGNMEYNRLAIDGWLRTVRGNFALEKLVRPLAPEQEKTLQDNVDTLSSGIRESMKRHLSDYFSEEEIRRHVESKRASFIEKISDPLTYALKVPIFADEVKKLVDEFDARLMETVPRIPKRLALVERIDEPQKHEEALQHVKAQILWEITSGIYTLLGKKTIDPDLAKVDPEALEPGITGIVQKAHAMKVNLLRERMHQQMDARAAERDRKDREKELRKKERLESSVLALADERIKRFGKENPPATSPAESLTASAPSPGPGRTGGEAPVTDGPSPSSAVPLWVIGGLVVCGILMVFGVVVYIKGSKKGYG